MVSLNTDKRLIFPFFLITLAFFISTYLIADTYHTSPAGFELLKTAQARLEQVRTSVADQGRAAASRTADMAAAVDAAIKDLDSAAAGMEEMAAAHGEMADGVAAGIKNGRQWLEGTARERSEQIGRILSGMKDGVNPEAADQLKSRIGDLPAAPEFRTMADGLMAYETAYNGALEAIWKLMYRYPDTGEIQALADQLDTLRNLSDTRRLAADLPDKGQLASLVKDAVANLAAPDLEAAIRPLPEGGQLLALLAARNQRIEEGLSALAEALDKGPGKRELTAGFDVLENLSTLDTLRDRLSGLPSPEFLTESLSRFPETGPVRSAAGLLPQLPGRGELAALLGDSISPAALAETEKAVSGFLASDPVINGLADHFQATVPGELQQAGPVSKAMASVRNQLTLTLKLSDPTGPEGVDPAGLAKESGKDIQSFINRYGELNRGNRTFVLAVMGGFLGVMILCFLMVCLRLPRMPAGDRAPDPDQESSESRSSRTGKAVSQLVALEENLGLMPGKLTEIRTMARENQDQSRDIFESAGIVHGNIRRVAGAMEQASKNLITISTAAEGITGSINEIVKNSESARVVTEEAVAETRNTTAKVSELGEAADSIDSVTHAINEISEQTNLLALNATIEAARAGEAGKGFAVVANEVKALARQTAEATEDISRKVAHINTITEEMVSQIERISDTIHNGNEMVTSIALAVENQSVSTREIADNVGQASRGISEVSGKVSANLEFVSGILDSIGTVEKKSEALSKEADDAIGFSSEQVVLAEKLGRLLDG